MRYELKALGVGEILDQSIRVLKDHFGLFLKIMFCLQIPLTLIFQFAALGMQPDISSNPTPEEMRAVMQSQTVLLPITFLFLALSMMLVVPLTNAAIVHATSCVYLGRETSVRDAFSVGLSRFLPLIWTWFLVYCFVMVGLVLCILPGILMLFRYGLAANVAVVEGISGMDALNRSKFLMTTERTKHYNQFFLLGLTIGAIGFGLNLGAAMIPQAHMAVAATVIAQGLQSAFGLIATVVFYFSCRCRVENFDLDQLAQAVEVTPVLESGPPE
ncbi:MAG: hypothetical protein AB7O26_13700 [Planctomycetaceae bacterium]